MSDIARLIEFQRFAFKVLFHVPPSPEEVMHCLNNLNMPQRTIDRIKCIAIDKKLLYNVHNQCVCGFGPVPTYANLLSHFRDEHDVDADNLDIHN